MRGEMADDDNTDPGNGGLSRYRIKVLEERMSRLEQTLAVVRDAVMPITSIEKRMTAAEEEVSEIEKAMAKGLKWSGFFGALVGVLTVMIPFVTFFLAISGWGHKP